MATTSARSTLQKPAQTIHPTTKTKSEPPLDFSFFSITLPKGKFGMGDFTFGLILRLSPKFRLSLKTKPKSEITQCH